MPLDNPNELFYWVDENDNVLGSITRGQAHNGSNKIHRSVYVLIINDKNELLIQKRSAKKDMKPLYWAESVGGHVEFGKTCEDAAVREVKEELGITTDKRNLKEVGRCLFKLDGQREYSVVYTLTVQNPSVTVDPDEITKVRWIPVKELAQFINNPLVASGFRRALKIAQLV